MNKVFIIHGFEGSPNGGWRPWLMGELGKQNIYACAISMPNPNNPVPSEWIEEISRHVERNEKDQIYLIGHSLGVPAILRYLEETKATNVNGLVLVSGPAFKTTKKKVAEFLEDPFNFKLIKSKVNKVVVIHGDDDRIVSVDQGQFLAKELNAELIIIKNGRHLNGADGWYSLPPCSEALLRIMN